jgi:hypothetical protein
MNGAKSHDPADVVWIGRNAHTSHDAAAPNHSWVEVTHCSSGVRNLSSIPRNGSSIRAPKSWFNQDLVSFHRAIGPAWFYAAPGSGVSINVGRSIVATKGEAVQLLDKWRPHRRGCRYASRSALARDVGFDSIQVLRHKEVREWWLYTPAQSHNASKQLSPPHVPHEQIACTAYAPRA